VKKALDKSKEGFAESFHGPVSKAYRSAYEPEDDAEKKYFEAVIGGSDHLKLGVHCHTADGEDIHLPCIKYIYSSKENPEPAIKRPKVDN